MASKRLAVEARPRAIGRVGRRRSTALLLGLVLAGSGLTAAPALATPIRTESSGTVHYVNYAFGDGTLTYDRRDSVTFTPSAIEPGESVHISITHTELLIDRDNTDPCETTYIPPDPPRAQESWFLVKVEAGETAYSQLGIEVGTTGTTNPDQWTSCGPPTLTNVRTTSVEVPGSSTASLAPGCYQTTGANPWLVDESAATGTIATLRVGTATCDEATRIVLRKAVNPVIVTADTFTFTGDLAGTIQVGEELAMEVEPGTYASTEAASNDWFVQSIICDDDDSSGDIQTRTATFNVASGETVVCTVTNGPDEPDCPGPTAEFLANWDEDTVATEDFNGSASTSAEPYPVTAWDWEFGDGATGSGRTVSHDYASGPGEYDVTLTVTNACGLTYSVEHKVTVNAPRTYAPEVLIHPDEKWFPRSANDSVADADLEWYAFGCPAKVVAANVNAATLGSGGYSIGHLPSNSRGTVICRGQREGSHSTADLTRPYSPTCPVGEPGPYCADPALRGRQGFTLNLGNSTTRPGQFNPQAPAYFDYYPDQAVVYWFHLGYSKPGGAAGTAAGSLPTHEGDWEHVVVHLGGDFDVMDEMTFFYHHWSRRIDRSEVEFAGQEPTLTHPVVYMAKWGHGSYPERDCLFLVPDFPYITADDCGIGFVWDTHLNLQDVRKQGWYGYGGAWGAGGRSSDTTGPTGPGEHKDPFGAG